MIQWIKRIFANRRHRVIPCTKTQTILADTVKLSVRDIAIAFHEARIIRDSGNA